MYGTIILSSFLFSLHASCFPQFHGHHGRRVCVGKATRVVSSTESFIQPVHKPYLTMCINQRICSTYKTVYKVSYRQVSRLELSSHVYSECCPGWRRVHSLNCNHALCVQTCLNGGSCTRPNHCACPLGWTGRYCQTDVDECKGTHGCSHQCMNSEGSYQCVCPDGFRLAEDKRSCLSLCALPLLPHPTSQPEVDNHLYSNNNRALCVQKCLNGGSCTRPNHCACPLSWTGHYCQIGGDVELVANVTEEVQMLRNRVQLLEQKLAMVLAPLSTLFPTEEDVANRNDFLLDRTDFLSDQVNFLSHSLRQLDRIDSLSEQVSFLEERLGSCSCQEN